MDVELRAALTPSTTSGTFDWSFGDGTSFQEVATSYSDVTHAYPIPATYVATVVVHSGTSQGSSNVTITVNPETLRATVVATPTSGPVPLTVEFRASPSGGTGTFETLVWGFGDGVNGSGSDLVYTYDTPGTYNASLTVTDSAGHNASTWVDIVVQSPAPPSDPRLTLDGLLWFLVVPAILLAAGAAIAVTYRWSIRRTASVPAERPAVGPIVEPPAEPPTPPDDLEESPATRALPPGMDESRRLSERILVHLYWYGGTTSDGVARVDSSQAGMARRLGVNQNTLSKALRRLLDAGAIRVELQHVPGAPRRLKSYSLTARGEAVAKALRARSIRPRDD